MKAPDFPPNEPERLKTLKSLNILDTAPEERFDRLTRITKQVFDVPIALISLLDEDRQWFKSRQGFDITETPREISFCGHAILEKDIFVVPDATKDERFADNPLVLMPPKIHFYAGCSLTASNGSKLGTLCIIDNKPRRLSIEERKILTQLGHMAEQELAAIQLSTLDQMTGLTNRQGFTSLASYIFQLCARKKLQATLLFIELIFSESGNTKLSYAQRDKFIATFAKRIKSLFPNADLLARVNKLEFVVLFTETTGAVIDKTLQKLQQHLALLDKSQQVRLEHKLIELLPDESEPVDGATIQMLIDLVNVDIADSDVFEILRN